MRHRISIFLMTASLLLLAAFLFFYLKNTWKDELARLKKETSYIFINSIHGIEGKLLDKLVLFQMQNQKDTHTSFQLPRRQAFLPDSAHVVMADTVKVMKFFDHQGTKISSDSTFSVRIRTSHGDPSEADVAGSLSMVIAMSGKPGDSISMGIEKPDILPVLEKHFANAVKTAELPVKYRIVRLQKDTLPNDKVLLTGSYTDLVSGERYAVELTGYKGYVFAQMLPQVLFSLGLFICVALAFFTVFQSLREQRRLTELKNDFIQNVTHELKTPIATVGVALEALQNFDALQDPARTKEYLDISQSELNRLSLLVDKVLRMSQFEKAAPELKLETFDMELLIREILNSMKLQFEKSGASVSFEPGGGGFLLEGDRLHLASVIYNLLDNALKYSFGKPIISIGLEQLNGQIYLRVKDNGVGIPEEYRGRIFEKFFRVPTGEVHNVKGHGLGLSYVATVVQKHQGIIEVENNTPQGTIFKIILPKAEKKAA